MITVVEFTAKQADFQSHFSMSKISQICLFFSLKNIKLGEELLLVTLFDYFQF